MIAQHDVVSRHMIRVGRYSRNGVLPELKGRRGAVGVLSSVYQVTNEEYEIHIVAENAAGHLLQNSRVNLVSQKHAPIVTGDCEFPHRFGRGHVERDLELITELF